MTGLATVNSVRRSQVSGAHRVRTLYAIASTLMLPLEGGKQIVSKPRRSAPERVPPPSADSGRTSGTPPDTNRNSSPAPPPPVPSRCRTGSSARDVASPDRCLRSPRTGRICSPSPRTRERLAPVPGIRPDASEAGCRFGRRSPLTRPDGNPSTTTPGNGRRKRRRRR